MARQTWVQLFDAQTTDDVSASFLHQGSTMGIYIVGVMGTASIILEARVPPEATNISAPSTFVPVVNGEWRNADMYPTDYTVAAASAVGMMKTLNSVSAQYRLRLTGVTAGTTVWAYMTRT